MTLQEAERRRRQSERDRQQHDARPGSRVRSVAQWCALNGFSVSTGRRIIASGNGPRILQLSPRRIGIRDSDNEAWQSSRAR